MKKTKTGLHIETRKNRIEVYTKKDLLEKELDILEGKIKFTYDGKDHQTSIDDFVNWAHNSVLPLQYESRKVIKGILKQFVLKG